MSYDLMVFDVSAAPRDRMGFLAWHERQIEWAEPHGYNNPDVPAAALRKWFRDMIETFPPRNGPLAGDDPDDAKVTAYRLGRSVIYGVFAWSQAESAYKHVKELAAGHGVGFFDVSGDYDDIWWPIPEWKLTCEVRGEIPLPLDLAFGETVDKLDCAKNSFFILEHANGNYMQCGGSKTACTVEFRVYDGPRKYKHYVVGRADSSAQRASVTMSEGVVDVRQCEILRAVEAGELFDLFFAGKEFPKKYAVRVKDL